MCHGPLQQQTRPSCHAGDNSSFPFAFESRPRRRFTIRWSTTIHTAVPMHTLRASHSLKEGCRKPVLGVWPMQPPCIVCCLMSRSDRRRSRGVERGSARRSSLKGRERAIVNQTNVGTALKATLGTLLRDRVGAHMGFSSA